MSQAQHVSGALLWAQVVPLGATAEISAGSHQLQDDLAAGRYDAAGVEL